jgi:hypothetical protein
MKAWLICSLNEEETEKLTWEEMIAYLNIMHKIERPGRASPGRAWLWRARNSGEKALATAARKNRFDACGAGLVNVTR